MLLYDRNLRIVNNELLFIQNRFNNRIDGSHLRNCQTQHIYWCFIGLAADRLNPDHILLYIETKSIETVSTFAISIFWLVLPSLLFFSDITLVFETGTEFLHRAGARGRHNRSQLWLTGYPTQVLRVQTVTDNALFMLSKNNFYQINKPIKSI